MSNMTKGILIFIAGALLGWVAIACGGLLLGTAIYAAVWLIPILVVLAIVYLVYRTIVGNVEYSSRRRKQK